MPLKLARTSQATLEKLFNESPKKIPLNSERGEFELIFYNWYESSRLLMKSKTGEEVEIEIKPFVGRNIFTKIARTEIVWGFIYEYKGKYYSETFYEPDDHLPDPKLLGQETPVHYRNPGKDSPYYPIFERSVEFLRMKTNYSINILDDCIFLAKDEEVRRNKLEETSVVELVHMGDFQRIAIVTMIFGTILGFASIALFFVFLKPN